MAGAKFQHIGAPAKFPLSPETVRARGGIQCAPARLPTHLSLHGGVTRRLVVQRRVNQKVSREAALRSRYLGDGHGASRLDQSERRCCLFKDGSSRIAE